jgi:hypothetical protein
MKYFHDIFLISKYFHHSSCLTISTPKTQSALLGVDKSYKLVVHCEAALNQLVQFSIQQQ